MLQKVYFLMAINRVVLEPERLRITVYPHIREHDKKRYFQAGVLVEEIPGVVDWDYIYYRESMKKLIGKLVVSKPEWVHNNSYTVQIVQKAPRFEKIFAPRHSMLGEISDMPDGEFIEFRERFERLVRWR